MTDRTEIKITITAPGSTGYVLEQFLAIETGMGEDYHGVAHEQFADRIRRLIKSQFNIQNLINPEG